ncbi:hypothetical protein PTSG_04168 [Salpingoeca rosetta]|uniref:Uncharacterized protein n=1 Tax=Salpingoeca rosetta (strain ATCC 50818 / BSB-021) TaxID=946362 RepID=F2U6T1_SALR5|nr:uncharacterized protein PTSG_04168 [Salpingoeca rosetta]EGD83563.1 hypothetical protein PTSG_04168 [Salpingoeca rosetta]|eukprot:XP_004995067.1 hypothetical protein PTSG_04168 [Salpingoeca rosetta]
MDAAAYTPEVVKSLQIAKVFDDSTKVINAIDFSDNGEQLVTSGNDNEIHVYNVLEAQRTKKVPSQKYGCSHVRFTHSSMCILHASTQKNNDVRYLSLHDSKYLRYFKGHTDRVTNIDMNPTTDAFLTTSDDCTMRLWDLRSDHCQGCLKTDKPSVACFDSTGLVMAVGVNGSSINLYDARKYEKGPFAKFEVKNSQNAGSWTKLQASPDSQHFALTTGYGLSFMIDAFSGEEEAALGDRELATAVDLSADFTPCGRFFATAGKGGVIDIWNIAEKKKEAHLTRHHDDVSCVRFNPKYMMMASTCSNLCLWLPSPS